MSPKESETTEKDVVFPFEFRPYLPPKCFKGDSSYTRRVVENGIAFRFGMKREILVGSGI